MPADFSLVIDISGIDAYVSRVKQGLGKVVRTSGGNIEVRAKLAIQTGPKTGRVYGAETVVGFNTKYLESPVFVAHKGKKLGDDKVHQASAPGEAPANDFGKLAGSIHFDTIGETSGELVVDSEYGPPLEFGTEDGKIAPRPFIGPAVKEERDDFLAAGMDVLRKAAS